jgi:hypothetical protein
VAHDLVVDNVGERIAQDLANFSARRPHTPPKPTAAEV